MASMLTRKDRLALICGSEARVYSFSSSSSSSSNCSSLSLLARISCELKPTTTSSDDADSNQQSEEVGEASLIPGHILSAAISNDGTLLALCDDYKRLQVWRLPTTKQDDVLTSPPSLLRRSTLCRRSTAITFTLDDKSVLVADKNGDAYLVQIHKQDMLDVSPIRILGHLGMMLDIRMTLCGKFVISCDRDEKIRVSHYPNAYNIHSYHLAHSQFVYRLCIPADNPRHFISGGGDGAVIFWRLENPKPLTVLHTSEDLKIASTEVGISSTPENLQVKLLEYSRPYLCVGFSQVRFVLVYRVDFAATEKANLVQTLEFPSPPTDFKFAADGGSFLVVTPSTIPPLRRFCVVEIDAAAIVDPFVESEAPTFEEDDATVASFFEAESSAPNLFGILTKTKVDNVKTYLIQKEKRIAEKSTRWGNKKVGAGGGMGDEMEEATDAKKTKKLVKPAVEKL